MNFKDSPWKVSILEECDWLNKMLKMEVTVEPNSKKNAWLHMHPPKI